MRTGFATLFNEGFVMNEEERRCREGRGGSPEGSNPRLNRDSCHEYPDVEQVRSDLFREAVQQVLARHAKALDGEANKARGTQPLYRSLLTSSELQFLLKPDS